MGIRPIALKNWILVRWVEVARDRWARRRSDCTRTVWRAQRSRAAYLSHNPIITGRWYNINRSARDLALRRFDVPVLDRVVDEFGGLVQAKFVLQHHQMILDGLGAQSQSAGEQFRILAPREAA
jgi:hypothetical protein